MRQFVRCVLGIVLIFGLVGHAFSLELLFASEAEAKGMLSARDEFIVRMSPFDRAARMKTAREVSEAQFLEFVASAAEVWGKREREKVESAFRAVKAMVVSLSLPLPKQVYVVKTSGIEEGKVAYTRGNTIFLPENILAASERDILRLLAHELFHISSRNNPDLSRALYKSIGFHYCGEIEFPEKFTSRKITNPDAPKNDYCIQLVHNRQKVWAVPVLISQAPKYDTARGGEFFQYLKLSMLLVEPPSADAGVRVLYIASGPRLADLQQFSGFFEQVGQNTGYVIHPEEILADNFSLLVMGERDVRSPEVLTRMQKILSSYKLNY
jgi:hypothetical protein